MTLNEKALEELVRNAMASGAMVFAEKAGRGEVDPAAPLTDVFDDFPADFVRFRRDLVEALTSE